MKTADTGIGFDEQRGPSINPNNMAAKLPHQILDDTDRNDWLTCGKENCLGHFLPGTKAWEYNNQGTGKCMVSFGQNRVGDRCDITRLKSDNLLRKGDEFAVYVLIATDEQNNPEEYEATNPARGGYQYDQGAH
jgi:hypothetical protein